MSFRYVEVINKNDYSIEYCGNKENGLVHLGQGVLYHTARVGIMGSAVWLGKAFWNWAMCKVNGAKYEQKSVY